MRQLTAPGSTSMTDDVHGPHQEPPGRLRHLNTSLRELGTARDTDETLQLMVDLAVDVVGGVDVASLMIVQGDRVTTPVCSDELAAELDRAQHEAGEGPCFDAIFRHDSEVSHDLQDEDRWPGFCGRALDLGVRSVAAYRLFRDPKDGEERYGALNLFGRSPGFDEHDLEIGAVFAALCSAVLTTAMEQDGTEVALLAREVVGQAKGALMVSHGVGPDQAYDILRRASSEHDIEVHVFASQVVAGTASMQ